MPIPRARPRGVASSASSYDIALQRLKARCKKAADAATRGTALPWDEVVLAADDVRNLVTPSDYDLDLINIKASVWAVVREENLVGLLALYAAALRGSESGPDESCRAACASMRARMTHQLTKLGAEDHTVCLSAQALCSVAMGMLRSHTFRCYASLLSDAMTQLQQRRSRRNVQTALDVVNEVCSLLCGFADRALGTPRWAPPNYLAELVSELRASGLLEHWARLVLLLGGCEGTEGELAARMWLWSQVLLVLTGRESSLLTDSPCLSYLLSAHTVRLCAALDGGTTYGLPPPEAAAAADDSAAAGVAPLYNATGKRLQLRGADDVGTQMAQWALLLWTDAIQRGRQQLQADLALANGPGGGKWRQAFWKLEARRAAGDTPGAGPSNSGPPPPPALRRWVGCAAVPPLHTRAAFELSLRIAAAAVAAMEGGQQRHRHAQGGAAGRGAQATRLRVPEAQAGALALAALTCAASASTDVATAAAVPQWAQRRLEEYWRVVLTAVSDSREAEGGDRMGDVGERWSHDNLSALLTALRVPDAAAKSMPVEPTPDVAAALAAGWVAGVERMLRRMGEDFWPVQLRACHGSETHRGTAAAWGQVLAFGARREVLSLLATVAKRKRIVRSSLVFDGAYDVELVVSPAPLQWLPQAPSPLTPAWQQLRLALSFIATRLVPQVLGDVGFDSIITNLDSLTHVPELLGWVPLLAAARSGAAWAPAGAAAGANGGTDDEEGDSAAGPPSAVYWCPPAFITTALRMAAKAKNAEVRRRLAPALRDALRALLYLAPERLAAGLAQAASKPAGVLGLFVVEDSRAVTQTALLRVLGPGGEAPDAEVLAVAQQVLAAYDGQDTRPAVEVAAAAAAARERQARADMRRWLDAAALLASPAEVAAALPPLCSNPRCTNLAGDSEAGLPLQVVRAGPGFRMRAYCSARCRNECERDEHKG